MDVVQTFQLFGQQHLECIGLVRPGETPPVCLENKDFQLVEERRNGMFGLDHKGAVGQLFDAVSGCFFFSFFDYLFMCWSPPG